MTNVYQLENQFIWNTVFTGPEKSSCFNRWWNTWSDCQGLFLKRLHLPWNIRISETYHGKTMRWSTLKRYFKNENYFRRPLLGRRATYDKVKQNVSEEIQGSRSNLRYRWHGHTWRHQFSCKKGRCSISANRTVPWKCKQKASSQIAKNKILQSWLELCMVYCPAWQA